MQMTVAAITRNRHIDTFADDPVIVSLLGDGEVGRGLLVEDFVSRCENAFLQLNICV